MLDLNTGNFELGEDKIWLNSRHVNFEVAEYPGGDAQPWSIQFNPPMVRVQDGTSVKTHMTISLTSPSDPNNIVQNGIIKVRIRDTWAIGNLWWNRDRNTTIQKLIWFIGAITAGYGRNSGKALPED